MRRRGERAQLSSISGDLAVAVAYAVDRARVVVGHEQRAVLHNLHVYGPAGIFVVLEKAREKRLDRLYPAVLVEPRDDDLAALFFCGGSQGPWRARKILF